MVCNYLIDSTINSCLNEPKSFIMNKAVTNKYNQTLGLHFSHLRRVIVLEIICKRKERRVQIHFIKLKCEEKTVCRSLINFKGFLSTFPKLTSTLPKSLLLL